MPNETAKETEAGCKLIASHSNLGVAKELEKLGYSIREIYHDVFRCEKRIILGG